MAHPRLDWWKEVRENPKVNPTMRRNGDILYGFIEIYRFPKTHRKLELERYKSKRHKGLQSYGRLGQRIDRQKARWISSHFKSYPDTARGKISAYKRSQKIRRYKVKEYGRRHLLILGPRTDRWIKKYGYPGG